MADECKQCPPRPELPPITRSRRSSSVAFTVLDCNSVGGKPTQLVSLWRQRRAVLVFFRHLGCRMTAKLAAGLNSIYDALHEGDTRLIAISLGTVEEGVEWKKRIGWRGELYVDPSTPRSAEAALHSRGSVVYNSFKLVAKRGNLICDAAAEAAAKASADGFEDWHGKGSDTEWPGDVFQLGGVFVLGPGNTCDFAFRAQYLGHHPDLQTVLTIATGTTGAGSEYVYPSTQAWVQSLGVSHRSFATASRGRGRSSSNAGFFLNDAGEAGEPEGTGEAASGAGEGGQGKGGAEASKSIASNAAEAKADAEAGAGAGNEAAAGAGKSEATSSASTSRLSSPQTVLALLSVAAGLAAVAVRQSQATPEAPVSLWLNLAFAVGLAAACIALSKAPWARLWLAVRGDPVKKEAEAILAQLELNIVTTKDIDRISQEAGPAQCDCPTVLSEIDVQGTAEVPVSPMPSPQRGELAEEEGEAEAPETALLHQYHKITCYLREFLAKPHPLVGRRGAVCPFIPKSLRKDRLYMAVVRTNSILGLGDSTEAQPVPAEKMELARQVVIGVVRKFAATFHTLQPTEGRELGIKAGVLVFPELQDSDAPALIDGVQFACKSEFVSRGMMLGEFHRFNNSSGLRNPNFFPLRTPYPSLAMRYMVPSDLPFLNPAKYPAQLRVQFLESFLSRFGAEEAGVSREAKEVAVARTALVEAREALARGG